MPPANRSLYVNEQIAERLHATLSFRAFELKVGNNEVDHADSSSLYGLLSEGKR
jgi:hypothetical protein